MKIHLPLTKRLRNLSPLSLYQRWLPYAHQRVLLTLAGGTMVAVGITAYLSYQAVREIILHNLTQNALLEVRGEVGAVEAWLGQRRAEVEMIANSPTARSLDWERIQPYLDQERQRLPYFHLLAFLDQQGIYYTNQGRQGDASDRPFFRRAMQGETNVSEPIISRSTGILQVSFAAPIPPPPTATSSRPIGVISCPVPVDLLQQVIEELEYGEGSYAFLLNSRGIPIIHPDPQRVGTEKQPAPSLRDDPDPQLAHLAHQMLATAEPAIGSFTLAGEEVYVAYMHLEQADWAVALVIPRLNIEGQLGDLNWLAMLIGGLLAAMVGASILVVASLRDRTLLQQLRCELRDRRQAEQALRSSEERFRQVAENMHEIVYLFTVDFQEMLYLNPAYETISGYSLGAVGSDPQAWLRAVHPEDRDRLRQALADPEQRASLDLQCRLLRPGGDVRWLHIRNFPVHNTAGEIYRIAGLAEDITDRRHWEQLQAEMQTRLAAQVEERTAELRQTNERLQGSIREREQAEQEVRQLEERFRALFTQAPVGLAACDSAGYCLDVNSALCDILGAEAADLAAQRLPELLADAETQASADYFASLTRSPSIAAGPGAPPTPLAWEQRCQRLDGREIWIRLTLAPLTAATRPEEPAVIAVVENITERKQTEQQKEEFLAIASHELRTPLTTMQASLDLLSTGKLGDFDPRGQQLLEFARLDTERLIRLANQLLCYQRLRFGRGRSAAQWFPVADLAASAQRAVAEQAAQYEVGVELSVPAGLAVYGDRDALERVAINLLDNAIKFSPPGQSVWLRAQAVPTDHPPPAVHLEVEDQGVGIADDQLERIFKPFEQCGTPARFAQAGTGLGLAICQQIVQQHGSTLQVKSQVGQGSCFFFTLSPGSGTQG